MALASYSLLSVTRKLGAHYIEKVGDDNFFTENVLAICLPFGNSLGYCIKLKYFNNKYYLSIIHIVSDTEGVGIICLFDSIKEIFDNNMSTFIDILHILSLHGNTLNGFETIFQSITINKEILTEIDNIQSAIISLFINKKIFILDSNYQIFSIICSLIELLPEKFHFFLNFTINSNSFTENVTIMSIQHTKELVDQLDDLNKEKNTIIDIKNRICFGIYSAPIFVDIMKNLKKQNIDKVREIFTNLELLIFEDSKIGLKYSEVSKKYRISKTDFKLIEEIRFILLDIPQHVNLFEALIK